MLCVVSFYTTHFHIFDWFEKKDFLDLKELLVLRSVNMFLGNFCLTTYFSGNKCPHKELTFLLGYVTSYFNMKMPQLLQNTTPKSQSIDDISVAAYDKALASSVLSQRKKALSFPLVGINGSASKLSHDNGIPYYCRSKLTGIGVCNASDLNKKLIVISQIPDILAFNSSTQSRVFVTCCFVFDKKKLLSC
ncbi:hypothetical protein RFI_19389 [Reticulomyxa filosa]|uniref:Uncharacterized protein n=1 Tax=Reticulomyxa filosa TaxID=46433 RepID=X6MXX4_RETFI|nr:hypothetical protein RFI_19389 [Reticulomyxa filosa]|eukprot:ETO17915.1 hypothetical protein RFI_19389 [Reticulomyxa filosa]